jgi:hypothetical protein
MTVGLVVRVHVMLSHFVSFALFGRRCSRTCVGGFFFPVNKKPGFTQESRLLFPKMLCWRLLNFLDKECQQLLHLLLRYVWQASDAV